MIEAYNRLCVIILRCIYVVIYIQLVAEHNSHSVLKRISYVRQQKAKSLNYFSTELQYQFYENEISRRQGLWATPSKVKNWQWRRKWKERSKDDQHIDEPKS